MTPEADKALQVETDFLSGVAAKLEAAKGTFLRGTKWQRRRDDERDRLRAVMAQHRIFDRAKLKSLPANRRIAVEGFERRWWWFGMRATGVAIASVVSPLEHYVSGEGGDAPPIGLGELTDHLRRMVGQPRVPHVIGICSPTGFTDEVYETRVDMPNVTVVLIEPGPDGGWRKRGVGGSVDERILQLFDPEGSQDKLDRAKKAIEADSASLLAGGISVSSVARKAHLPEDVVRTAFEQVAEKDTELRVTDKEGEFLLFRGAAAPHQERKSMNVIDRIKQLFSSEGDITEKINLLAERRAALAHRRDRLYEEISQFETKEAEVFDKGKAAKSSVPRRRLAAQLAQLRKDIGRQNTTASMLNHQINIISTDIHNLTLIQQGEMAQLPDTAELTENAVKAEELLESLRADSELVSGLGSDLEVVAASDEELAILKEFEAADQPIDSVQDSASAKTSPQAEPTKRVAESSVPPLPPEPESKNKTKRGDADAEPT